MMIRVALLGVALGGCHWVLPFHAPADTRPADARPAYDTLAMADRPAPDALIDAPRDTRPPVPDRKPFADRAASGDKNQPKPDIPAPDKTPTADKKPDLLVPVCGTWSSWICTPTCNTVCTSCEATCGGSSYPLLSCTTNECSCQKSPMAPTVLCPSSPPFNASNPCDNTCMKAFQAGCCKS